MRASKPRSTAACSIVLSKASRSSRILRRNSICSCQGKQSVFSAASSRARKRELYCVVDMSTKIRKQRLSCQPRIDTLGIMSEKPLSPRELRIWHAFLAMGEEVLERVGRDIAQATGLSGPEFGVLSRLAAFDQG